MTDFRVEAREFSDLLREVKRFSPDLNKSIRKEIRVAAKPAVTEVKQAVRGIPTSGESQGVRRAVAAGVGLRIVAGKNGGGVSVRASSRRLPEGRKAMAKLLNRPKWRHPVFGNTDRWVNQYGRPYFDATLLRHEPQIRAAILRALDTAATALGRRR